MNGFLHLLIGNIRKGGAPACMHVPDITSEACFALRCEHEQDDTPVPGIRTFFQKPSAFQLLYQLCDAGQGDVQADAHVADPAGAVLLLKRVYGIQYVDMPGFHSRRKLRKRFDDPLRHKAGIEQLFECGGGHGIPSFLKIPDGDGILFVKKSYYR